MPQVVAVWCRNPQQPNKHSRIGINLDRTAKVRLGDYPRETPVHEDLWLYFDPLEQFWFIGYLPFRRLSDVEVKHPNGRIDRFRSSGTIESCRIYKEIHKEEAQSLAREYKVALPSGPTSVVTGSKRPRKVRRTKKPAF